MAASAGGHAQKKRRTILEGPRLRGQPRAVPQAKEKCCNRCVLSTATAAPARATSASCGSRGSRAARANGMKYNASPGLRSLASRWTEILAELAVTTRPAFTASCSARAARPQPRRRPTHGRQGWLGAYDAAQRPSKAQITPGATPRSPRALPSALLRRRHRDEPACSSPKPAAVSEALAPIGRGCTRRPAPSIARRPVRRVRCGAFRRRARRAQRDGDDAGGSPCRHIQLTWKPHWARTATGRVMRVADPARRHRFAYADAPALGVVFGRRRGSVNGKWCVPPPAVVLWTSSRSRRRLGRGGRCARPPHLAGRHGPRRHGTRRGPTRASCRPVPYGSPVRRPRHTAGGGRDRPRPGQGAV